MVDLEGKVICNAFMECDYVCSHRVPHELGMLCHMTCDGTCVPIQVFWENDRCVYAIKRQDGNYHRITPDPAPEIPISQAPAVSELYMDEKIYICSSHANCSNDNCLHKEFHNRNQGCGNECHHQDSCGNIYGVTCREANNEEILQLFREHDGENQHIADMLEQDDKAYSDFIEVLAKSKPETPKLVPERVKRFLNLEL